MTSSSSSVCIWHCREITTCQRFLLLLPPTPPPTCNLRFSQGKQEQGDKDCHLNGEAKKEHCVGSPQESPLTEKSLFRPEPGPKPARRTEGEFPSSAGVGAELLAMQTKCGKASINVGQHPTRPPPPIPSFLLSKQPHLGRRGLEKTLPFLA